MKDDLCSPVMNLSQALTSPLGETWILHFSLIGADINQAELILCPDQAEASSLNNCKLPATGSFTVKATIPTTTILLPFTFPSTIQKVSRRRAKSQQTA